MNIQSHFINAYYKNEYKFVHTLPIHISVVFSHVLVAITL